MFTVGQIVECVDDNFSPAKLRLFAQLPKLGATYRVRDVRVVAELGNDVSILLDGVFNPQSRMFPQLERGFDPGHFVLADGHRKQSRKTTTAEFL